MLNWKYRNEDHFEAYWYLLHNWAPRFRSAYSPGRSEYTANMQWKTIKYSICYRVDSLKHGFWECPMVNKIWLASVDLLKEMTGRPNIAQGILWTWKEVLLGFPQTKRYLPKELRARLVLWHSTIIFLIWSRRRWAIKDIQLDTLTGSPNFLEPLWATDLKSDLRKNVSRIFERYKVDGKLDAFRREWTSETNLWVVKGISLSFSASFDELDLQFEVPLELVMD